MQKIDLSQFEIYHFIVRAMKHTEHKRNHFTFGEYLSQVRDSSCKKIKSLTFLITNVKISHDKALTSLVQQECFRCVNSPVCFVNISCDDIKSWITSQINQFILVSSVLLYEYLCKLLDDSCKWTKALTFLISDVKISHHRGLTSFYGKIHSCGLIVLLHLRPMRWESVMTS